MNCSADECGYNYEDADLPFPYLFIKPIFTDLHWATRPAPLIYQSVPCRVSTSDITGPWVRRRVPLWSSLLPGSAESAASSAPELA